MSDREGGKEREKERKMGKGGENRGRLGKETCASLAPLQCNKHGEHARQPHARFHTVVSARLITSPNH